MRPPRGGGSFRGRGGGFRGGRDGGGRGFGGRGGGRFGGRGGGGFRDEGPPSEVVGLFFLLDGLFLLRGIITSYLILCFLQRFRLLFMHVKVMQSQSSQMRKYPFSMPQSICTTRPRLAKLMKSLAPSMNLSVLFSSLHFPAAFFLVVCCMIFRV